MGLIVLGLAFLFFLVVAFFAAKTWHVGHIVAMSFLFLFTLLFLYMSAAMLRTHNTYRPRYTQAVQDYEREVKREQTLRFGDAASAAGEGTLVGERTLARVEQFNAGRTWGNVRRMPGPAGAIQLDLRAWTAKGYSLVGAEEDEEFGDDDLEDDLPADDTVAADDAADDGSGVAPAADALEAGDTHGILKDQFVYAFKELPIIKLMPEEKSYYFGGLGEGEDSFPNQDKKGRCRVPKAYLGRFRVTESTAQGISVVPVSTLNRVQAQQIQDDLPWVLYEKLPLDDPKLFKDVEPAVLAKLVADQRMLAEYQNTGKEFDGNPAQVNPYRLQQRVKFLREFEQIVDLVVDDPPATDKPFDAAGRAQMKSVMQGEPSKFAVGDEADFDVLLANRLVQDGVAERVGKPIYVRQMRDFQFLLNDTEQRMRRVADARSVAQRELNELIASETRVQEQSDKNAKELELLQQDQSGFEIERTQLEEYRSILRQRLDRLRREVNRLSQRPEPQFTDTKTVSLNVNP